MGDIKSALEIAKEKIEKIGEPTEEERLKWKYVPQGEQLGAKYMKEDVNLMTALNQNPANVKKYIAEGASSVLVRNINLPKNDAIKKANKKAMDGLKIIKSDKSRLENVYSQIRYLFNHYAEQGEKQRNQAFVQLKAEFEAKIRQAVQQQLGTAAGARIDVERQPQFQQEWYKMRNQLDSQYMQHLNEHKKELLAIP